MIDLRRNGGGNNYLVQPLIHAVLKSSLDAPGRLFVITDRGTFSAAQNCATRLERETWALFVGEPTGGRPNHFGDAEAFPLPGSGHVLRCSTVRSTSRRPASTPSPGMASSCRSPAAYCRSLRASP